MSEADNEDNLSRFDPEAEDAPKYRFAYLDPPSAHELAPEVLHAEAMAQGARCKECPLYGLHRGPIKDEPHPSPLMTLVVEGPVSHELETKRPLGGRTGQEVEKGLSQGGVSRYQVAVGSTILCSPGMNYSEYARALRLSYRVEKLAPYKRAEKEWRAQCKELGAQGIPPTEWPKAPTPPPPLILPHEACRPRLERFLAAHKAPVTLALGETPLNTVCSIEGVGRDRKKTPDDKPFAANIGSQHGAPVRLLDGRTLVAAFLPGFKMIKSKKEWLHVIRDDIARAAKIARSGGAIEWVDPFMYLQLGPDEVINAVEATINNHYMATVDIETDSVDRIRANIRCVQIATRVGPKRDPLTYVIRLAHMDGTPWWSAADTERIRRALCNMLDTAPLGAQFGTYDFTVLIEQGFMTDRTKPWVDALLLHKNTIENDLPHNLGFMARRLFDAPNWKSDVEHKSINNVDDSKLHKYGALDTYMTMRVIEALWPRVQILGTEEQYKTDYEQAPIFRQAGHMGLPIDEALRGHYSRYANDQVALRLKQFWELGKCHGLNPKSVPQLQQLIYGTWGYAPPVEEGEEAEGPVQENREIQNTLRPDEDPENNKSTSSQTLAVLCQMGISPEHAAALAALIRFRGIEKLRSTYIDGLQSHFHSEERMGFAMPSVASVSADVWQPKGNKWTNLETLPKRAAMSVMHSTYRQTIPTGRVASTPNCFDPETEILTKRGWVSFPDLLMTDEVAQVTQPEGPNDTPRISFVRPQRIIVQDFEGDLVRLESKLIDLLLTPDHRCLIRSSAKGRPFKIVPAVDWPHQDKHSKVLCTGRYDSKEQRKLSPEEITLICAVQADAEILGNGKWRFKFTKQRKAARLQNALDQLQIPYVFRQTQRTVRRTAGLTTKPVFELRTLNSIPAVDEFVSILPGEPGHLRGVKTFGPRLLVLDQATLKLFREEVLLWDGCATRQNHFSSSVKSAADWVQIINLLTRRRASLRKYHPARLTKSNWQVDQSRRKDGAEIIPRCTKTTVPYRGKVYCVTVDTGLIMIRRNGVPMVIPQCQNIPAVGEINVRSLFCAPPGHSYFGSDYKQLEGRIYAAVAQDRLLLETLRSGRDLHSANVAVLRAERPDRIEHWYQWAQAHKDSENDEDGTGSGKQWRTVAKIFVFALIYGSEIDTLFDIMRTSRDKFTRKLLFPKITRSEVSEWYHQWHRFHPETQAWWAKCKRFLHKHGYICVPTLDGRRRYFPSGPSKANAVMNTEIQATAGSTMNRAMRLIYKEIPFGRWSRWTGIVLQVHDDLRLLAPDTHANEVKRIIAAAMPYTYNGVTFEIDTPEQAKRIGKAPIIWTPSAEEKARGLEPQRWRSSLVEGEDVHTPEQARARAYAQLKSS